MDDVVPQQFKIFVAKQMGDIRLLAGEEVVHADNIVAVSHESLAEMAAEKSGTTSDQNPFEQGHNVGVPETGGPISGNAIPYGVPSYAANLVSGG